jgi:hypothetical protein
LKPAGVDVRDDSLTGADIDESSLSLPATAGFAFGGETPSTGETTVQSFVITTPAAGKLFVMASARVEQTTNCSDLSGCAGAVGVYVDGGPVDPTGRTYFFGQGTGIFPPMPFAAFGVTDVLPAGQHTVSLGSKRTAGDRGVDVGDVRLGTVLVSG